MLSHSLIVLFGSPYKPDTLQFETWSILPIFLPFLPFLKARDSFLLDFQTEEAASASAPFNFVITAGISFSPLSVEG